MITETESEGRKFKHLHFFEVCADNPTAILAVVEKLFVEIAQMPRHNWKPNTWFMRCYPEIERVHIFDATPMCQVRCRFSAEQLPDDPMPVLLGFGGREIK